MSPKKIALEFHFQNEWVFQLFKSRITVGNIKPFLYVISRLVHETRKGDGGESGVTRRAGSYTCYAGLHVAPGTLSRHVINPGKRAPARPLHSQQQGGRTRAHEKWKNRLPWLAESNLANLWRAWDRSDSQTLDVNGFHNNSEIDCVIFHLWIGNPGEVACFKLCNQMPLSL